MGMATSPDTAALVQWLTDLTPASIPEPVWLRVEDLFLDWLGSALASRNTHPIPIFASTAKQMGPRDGPAQILTNGETTSPYWAAWVNAASSHTLEQDDLHNSSVMHPATVIFPAVLAAAQDLHLPGSDLLLAAIAGYEAGARIAESLGRSHYRTFHTTGTVGTLAAALAVGKLLDFSYESMVDALGTAGTQTAGLWAFMASGAGDSKQLHCGHAAANGLLSAYMVRDGLKGAKDVVQGEAGLMQGMAKDDVNPAAMADRLGERWAVLETSFKFHACCRHTHPACDALMDAIQRHEIKDPLRDVKRVTARVHQGAIDVLGPVDALPAPGPKSVHAAKFSMKSTLALIALKRGASLTDFRDHALGDPDVLAFRERVGMRLDPEVDAAYPKRWLGRVEVELRGGTVVEGVCDEPKGDPGNTLGRRELSDKFLRLVSYAGDLGEAEGEAILYWCWDMRKKESCLIPGRTPAHEAK